MKKKNFHLKQKKKIWCKKTDSKICLILKINSSVIGAF